MATVRVPAARHGSESGSHPTYGSGSAFVEFSLVVLFLNVLLWGTFDLTVLLLDYNALNKKVRDAASFWSTHALDPATAMLMDLAASLDDPVFQGLPLQDVVANLARCGAHQCQASSTRPVAVQTGPCPIDGTPYPAMEAASEGALLTLCYCHDHDDLMYVTVRADYPHEFLLLSTVLGASVMLRASALMRIPSLVATSGSGSVPLCTPRL